MGLTKYSFARYKIIDRELHRKDWVKTKELAKIIKDELFIPVSTRQLQKDIEAMKNDPFLDYNAPIEYDEKNKAHRYIDKNFTIQAFKLIEEEINALKFFASSLNQYKDYNLFKDFSNAIDKVVNAVKIRSNLVSESDSKIMIQTDNNSTAVGSEYIILIIQGLEEKKIIEFEYQKFGEEKSEVKLIEPLLVKEYRNRWYLIGNSIKGNEKILRTYGLDRITGMKVTDKKFTPNKNFDPYIYYKHSFGIITEEKPIEKIILQFKIKESYFIKSLPIHGTQSILEETSDYIKISVEIIPSYEFFEFVLGYGESVKVISPKWVASAIKKRLIAAINQY